MSPAARLFHQRVERRAAALAPDLRAQLLRAYERMRARLTPSALEAFVRSPDAAKILDLLTEAAMERDLAGVSATLRDGVESAGQAIAKELPGAARDVSFNVLNPKIIEAVKTLETRVVQKLAADVRETVKVYVEQGLRDGINPRTIARELGNTIGLAPNQLDAVANFERMLRDGDSTVLTRALRDRRFDATIRKAMESGKGFTDEQIARMTDAYRKRFVAFHAETVTRTAALDAQRVGQQLTWEDAVARGDIDGTRLMKRWSGTLDDRERDSHLAMEGETVPHDQPYSNGQMTPGESEWNCRCVSIFSTRAQPKPGAGARGITPDQMRGVGAVLAGVA